MGVEGDARAFDGFGEEVIEGGEDEASLGVVAFLEFLRFFGMAGGTIFGGDDGGDVVSVVIEAIDISLDGLVAFDASDAFEGVGAPFPVVDDSRRGLAVAFDATVGGSGDGDVMGDDADLLSSAEDFEVLDQDERGEEEDSEESDDVLFEFEIHGSSTTKMKDEVRRIQ